MVLLKVHDLLIIFTSILLLNFLIGLPIMFALDHLSYLLGSYLSSEWFIMYSYPIKIIIMRLFEKNRLHSTGGRSILFNEVSWGSHMSTVSHERGWS